MRSGVRRPSSPEVPVTTLYWLLFAPPRWSPFTPPLKFAWSVDYSKPYPSSSVDYRIVARYRDRYTNGKVLIIAGIGPYGTEAASELVSSQYLSQIEHVVPGGFKNANLRLVIRTGATRGEAGPPQLVAAYGF